MEVKIKPAFVLAVAGLVLCGCGSQTAGSQTAETPTATSSTQAVEACGVTALVSYPLDSAGTGGESTESVLNDFSEQLSDDPTAPPTSSIEPLSAPTDADDATREAIGEAITSLAAEGENVAGNTIQVTDDSGQVTAEAKFTELKDGNVQLSSYTYLAPDCDAGLAAPTESSTVAPTESSTVAPTESSTVAPTESSTVAPTESSTSSS